MGKTQPAIWETLRKWHKKGHWYSNPSVWGLCTPILCRGVLKSTWDANPSWLTSPHHSVPLRTFTLSVYNSKLLCHFFQTMCNIATERGPTKKHPFLGIQDLVIGYPYMSKSWKTDKIWPHGWVLKAAYPRYNEIGPILIDRISGHMRAERSNKSRFYSAGSAL